MFWICAIIKFNVLLLHHSVCLFYVKRSSRKFHLGFTTTFHIPFHICTVKHMHTRELPPCAAAITCWPLSSFSEAVGSSLPRVKGILAVIVGGRVLGSFNMSICNISNHVFQCERCKKRRLNWWMQCKENKNSWSFIRVHGVTKETKMILGLVCYSDSCWMIHVHTPVLFFHSVS